jgi:histidyl-tRNA synthetase
MTPSATDFLKAATTTAEHFGFRTAEQLKRLPECRDCAVSLPYAIDRTRLDHASGILYDALSNYCEERLFASRRPLMVFQHHDDESTKTLSVSFTIYNVEKSIAEALLLHTTRTLLSDLGHRDVLVRLNSLGDSESVTRYSREIGNFLKRRLDSMPSDARELMKEHPLLALRHLVHLGHDLAFRCPNALEHLSDQSRKHFREIVEYLDMSETAYEIDPKMIGYHECYTDAIFSIDTPLADQVLSVQGGRINELVYRSTKTKTPVTGAVVTLHNARLPARPPRLREPSPSVYIVQLGFGPKIRTLLLIDTLRQAGIPLHHDLTSDSLSSQLRDAESRDARYTIIVGQKEYVDRTAILRDMRARTQETIPLDQLVKKLKRHVTVTA